MPTVEEYSAAFKLFDANGNGMLETEEVLSILTRQGGGSPLSMQDAQKVIDGMIAAGADLDGDGKLSIDEFARAWASSGGGMAEAASEAAIRDEVSRVAALSPEERSALGRDFASPDAIWRALELPGSPTVLLRASWLRKHKPQIMMKRGEFPAEAYIGAAELRGIYEGAAFGSTPSGWKRAEPLPVLSLSHYWRTQPHPDPAGKTMQLVVQTLEQEWEKFTKYGVSDLGIFIDYCSLYQQPRTAEQAPLFAASLGAINLW